jgi:3',5'-cyclic AMP phosphodiesterase CpdA
MRRLVHVSDLHFGTETPALVAALAESIRAFDPHLVIVTGDVTQRARPSEFERAQRFLSALEHPALVVPGNHDIAPLWRPFERAFLPFRRYQRYIGPELDQAWQDDELLVLAACSVRAFRWKEGSLSRSQRRWIRQSAERYPRAVRILATHHPVAQHRPDHLDRGVLEALQASDVSVCLSGHLHTSFSGLSVDRLGQSGGVLEIHACTATSTRLRGEANAYNRLTLVGRDLRVDSMAWDGNTFARAETAAYERSTGIWRRSSYVPAPALSGVPTTTAR